MWVLMLLKVFHKWIGISIVVSVVVTVVVIAVVINFC